MEAVGSAARGIVVARSGPVASGVLARVTPTGINGSDAPGGCLGHEFGEMPEDGSPIAIRPHRSCSTCPHRAGSPVSTKSRRGATSPAPAAGVIEVHLIIP